MAKFRYFSDSLSTRLYMTPAAADERRPARACDSCLCRQSRWYCASDDALLCQCCDAVVHSANPLANRHERVRLKVASSVSKREQVPSWMKGLKRKARTPRGRPAVVLVPDLASSEEHSADDGEDQQLLYRVPVFDPVVAVFRSSSSGPAPPTASVEDCKQVSARQASDIGHGVEGVHGIFLPTDAELAEFAADVESLLGRGLYEEWSFCMDGLGLMEARGGEGMECCFHGNDVGRVKVELAQDDVAVLVDGEASSGAASASSQVMEAERSVQDTVELNFDNNSPGEDEEMVTEEKSLGGGVELDSYPEEKEVIKIALRLDYKSVMAAWACQGSPWTTGDRPKLNPDDAIGGFAAEVQPYGGMLGGSIGGQAAGSSDGGREARVSRYREKRRTRLFSKKIRYEVRKLNAEKRPRMKGRFVKRGSFAPQGFAF